MTKIRRQLRAAWRRGLLKVKLSPSCITRDIHLHTGKVDRSWPTHSTPTPPPAPPRLPPRITILHLFDYEPIASTLCRYIHDTYAFSYRYQWRTIREDLAFAATCRVIHAHMARITFRQIEIYPNTKDATRWHPDSLSSIRYIGAHWIYVRTLISRAISFTSSAAHRFLHPIHRILQLTPSVEHIFNDELHSHMLSAYCGPLTERFESVTSMDITSHDDPRTIRYLRCFPSLCALAITISPRPHRKLGDVSSVPPFKRVEYLAIAETLKDVTIKDWHIHRLLPNLTDLCVYSDDYKSRVPGRSFKVAARLPHLKRFLLAWDQHYHRIHEFSDDERLAKIVALQEAFRDIWNAQIETALEGQPPSLRTMVTVESYGIPDHKYLVMVAKLNSTPSPEQKIDSDHVAVRFEVCKDPCGFIQQETDNYRDTALLRRIIESGSGSHCQSKWSRYGSIHRDVSIR